MNTALWALLTGTTAITALCGDRIFWGVAPQGTARPYLVLSIVGGADQPHLTGTDGLWKYRVQIDALADHRPQAAALAAAVVAQLNGYQSTNLRGIFVDATREEFEDAAIRRPSRISHDFIINWRA